MSVMVEQGGSSGALPLEYARAGTEAAATFPGRLVSLDVFRGLVILAMLIVNNPGDYRAVGYFFKHADWEHPSFLADWRAWMASPGVANFPVFMHCTLADYVMPMFMLIIGIAIPYSVASARRRGESAMRHWVGVVRRGATLYGLGWAIGLSIQFMSWRYSPNPNAKLSFGLYMDVLQLLGVSFVVARLVYCLPVLPRLGVAAGLYLWHWALLRFYPQGSVPAGTFTEKHNAVGYIYSHPTGFWWFFKTVKLAPWLAFNICGMLSVPTAAATMTVGTWAGELLRKAEMPSGQKVWRLLGMGAMLAAIGFVWAFDLPMNKPRWTPCYLLWCAGVGLMLLGGVYWAVDVRGWRRWTWPLVVLGVNAIGIYFLSVFGKVWALNIPRVNGEMLREWMVDRLQEVAGQGGGSWLFTGIFVLALWGLAALAYRYKVVWKV